MICNQHEASPQDAKLAPPQVVLLAVLAVYRRWISPAIHALNPGHGCKFLPTCSEYASIAIATHGPVRGVGLAAKRLLRCHPFTRGGLDLVPPAPISCHFPHQPLP
jgi:hypothetical protein